LLKYTKEYLEKAHNHCIYHRAELENSSYCGCFHCLQVFNPKDIICWIDEDKTALCPLCGIDSVIGDDSGYPVRDKRFLKAMYRRYFT